MDLTSTMTLVLLLLALVALAGVILLWARSQRALKAAHLTLAEDQDRLAFILRSAAVGVWSWDAASDQITADRTCSLLFGYEPGEFPPNLAGFMGALHPEDREPVQKALTRAIELNTEYKTSYRVVWPDGSVRWVAARARIALDKEGRPIRFLGVAWDTTEQKEAADELHSANEKLQRSLVELDKRSQENTLLAEMTDHLQSCGSSAEAHEITGPFCGRLFAGSAGALFIFRPSRNLLHTAATWNNPELPVPEFSPDECWALRRGQAHYIGAGKDSTPCRHLKGAARAGHACIPMMAQGTGLGVLYLQSLNGKPDAPFLTEADRQLCSTVAKQVALALANLNLQDALRNQTIRDPLTGLFNRRYLEDSLERELHRMARRQDPAGFVMMDIDNFKAFNDAYGHDGGDAVLRAFGAFLKERMRKEDIACRYGGEEFCVVLAESSLTDTARRCEQLRSEVKLLTVKHGGNHLPPISLSFGVAAFPVHGDTVAALIAHADDALYQAKAAGRDRVVVAPVVESAARV